MIAFLSDDTFKYLASPILAALLAVVIKEWALRVARLRDVYVATIWLELMVFSIFSIGETLVSLAVRAQQYSVAVRPLFDHAITRGEKLGVIVLALTLVMAPIAVSTADRSRSIGIKFVLVHVIALAVLGLTWLWILSVSP